MASSSRGTRRSIISSLLLAFVFIAFIFAASTSASPDSSSSSQPSASSDTSDSICHTSDPKECYPRIFQPTNDFQPVHEDQDLPPGLHVRLNINTGLKEAKINDPSEDNPSLAGLPGDQAVIVVDPDTPAETPAVIPKGAPKYENAGKIKEPQLESVAFGDGMKMLKSGKREEGFDQALEALEELSHDLYYGLKVAEDPEAVRALMCLMGRESAVEESVMPRDQQAASILAGALQNNPTALAEVHKSWDDLMGATCPEQGFTLASLIFNCLVPRKDAPISEDLPASSRITANRIKAKVSAINTLVKDDTIRQHFLRSNGMQKLLSVLLPEGKEWAGAQRKAGQLVLDNFLDEDMGATLGEWPTREVPVVKDAQCKEAEWEADEGCWGYHVERIMKANKKDKEHWSRDLHNRLTKAREDAGPPKHIEL